MLTIQESIHDGGTDQVVARRYHQPPGWVNTSNIIDYCRSRYGVPLGFWSARTDDTGPRVVGWSFSLPEGAGIDRDLTDPTVVVIPGIEVDGGVRVLFDVLREQQRVVERLRLDGTIDEVTILPAADAWRPIQGTLFQFIDEPTEYRLETMDEPSMFRDIQRALQSGLEDDPEVDALLERASDLIAEQDPTGALALADDALARGAELSASDRAHALAQRGNALSDLGQYDEAMAAYLDARALSIALAEEYDVANLDMELAITLERLGWHAQALERYRSALAAFLTFDDDAATARCQLNMASTCHHAGYRQEAYDLIDDAIGTFEALGMDREYVDTCFNLANLLWGEGDLDNAKTQFFFAQKEYEMLGLPVQMADCDDSLGVVAHKFGEIDRAIRLHRTALATYLDHDHPVEAAIARRNLGHALDHAGRYDEAWAELTTAADEYAAMGVAGGVATCRLLQAWVQVHRGDPTAAIALLAEARDLDRETGETHGLPYYNLCAGAALVVADRPTEAVAVLETAALGLEAMGDVKTLADARLELAGALLHTGNREAALVDVARARAAFETMTLTNRVAECDAHPAHAAAA